MPFSMQPNIYLPMKVCKVLMILKKHVDDFHDEGEEYWRLSVRSQTLNPTPYTLHPKPSTLNTTP